MLNDFDNELLQAISVLGSDEAYSRNIRKWVEQRQGKELSAARTYGRLYRLEQLGFVETEERPGLKRLGGPPYTRVHYRVTGKRDDAPSGLFGILRPA